MTVGAAVPWRAGRAFLHRWFPLPQDVPTGLIKDSGDREVDGGGGGDPGAGGESDGGAGGGADQTVQTGGRGAESGQRRAHRSGGL